MDATGASITPTTAILADGRLWHRFSAGTTTTVGGIWDGLDDMTAITLGSYRTVGDIGMVIRSDNSLWVWGDRRYTGIRNVEEEMGNAFNHRVPVQILDDIVVSVK